MGFFIPDGAEEQKRRRIWALSAMERGAVPFVRRMGISDGIDAPATAHGASIDIQRAIEKYAADIRIKNIKGGAADAAGRISWHIDFF